MHSFREGDRVRIFDFPEGYKDANYIDDPEMRTGELFRFCVGKEFTIQGFGRYGHIELRGDEDPAVKKKFGLNSIWIEPQFIELITKARRHVARPKNGRGWQEDFLKADLKFAEMSHKAVGKGTGARRRKSAI
jgi:hypothetical protein